MPCTVGAHKLQSDRQGGLPPCLLALVWIEGTSRTSTQLTLQPYSGYRSTAQPRVRDLRFMYSLSHPWWQVTQLPLGQSNASVQPSSLREWRHTFRRSSSMRWQVKRTLDLLIVVALLRLEVSTATAEADPQDCAWSDAASVPAVNAAHDSNKVDFEPVVSGMSALVLGGTGAVGEHNLSSCWTWTQPHAQQCSSPTAVSWGGSNRCSLLGQQCFLAAVWLELRHALREQQQSMPCSAVDSGSHCKFRLEKQSYSLQHRSRKRRSALSFTTFIWVPQ